MRCFRKGDEVKKHDLTFQLRLADLIVKVYPRYPTLQEFCKDYILKEDAYSTSEQDTKITVRITDKEIQSENALTEETYPPQYVETLAMLRQVADQMPEYNRVLCHGAVITWKENGYLFTAPSGTGKSTHISLWRKYLGPDVRIVNGDKPLMKIEPSEIRLYGTPWAGKEGWQKNRSTQLDGICILQQAKKNEIRRLNPAEALPLLIRQFYFTDSTVHAGKTLELMDLLLKKVPVYLLKCDRSEEAVKCSFEAMTGRPMPEKKEKRKEEGEMHA